MSATPGGRRAAARNFDALENVDPLWSTHTTAAILGITPKHLRVLVGRREAPPHVRIGRMLRFRRSAVEGWLTARAETSATTAPRQPEASHA